MTTQLAVRLPDDLLRQLDELVPTTHATRSEAVRRAIELYLYRLLWEHDVKRYEELPLTEDELALMNNPDAWSATPPW